MESIPRRYRLGSMVLFLGHLHGVTQRVGTGNWDGYMIEVDICSKREMKVDTEVRNVVMGSRWE